MWPAHVGVTQGGYVMMNWNVKCQRPWAKLKAFGKNEEGAITVEWVILTAGVCTLAMGMYIVFKIDPKQEVTDELSYIVLSNMPISMNPQTQEGMGPLDKLLEVIRYKTIVLRGCLGFGISSNAGTMGQTPDMRENLCSLL